jgi:hypothetical protein
MRKERWCRGQQRAEKDGSKNEKDGRKEVLDANFRESNGMKLCPSRSLSLTDFSNETMSGKSCRPGG